MRKLFSILIIIAVVQMAFSQPIVPNRRLEFLPKSASGGGDITGDLMRLYFDNNVLDSSGNSNDGTAVGTPTYGLSANGSTANGAIVLNGTSQYVTTPIKPSTMLTGSWTMNCWVNMTSGANAGYALCASTSGGSRLYLEVPSANGGTSIKIGLYSWNPVESSVITAGAWQMMTLVLDGTTGYFYINGSQVDTTTGITVSRPTTTMTAGAIQAGSANWFNGSMDDLRVYPFALTPTQISTLYSRGAKQ